MKLSVSNIAWAPEHDETAFRLLAELGVEWVELAPARISPWETLTPDIGRAYRKALGNFGLRVSSLQAIFFGAEGLSLLKTEDQFAALRDHIVKIAELADVLECRPGVWGAPGLKHRGSIPIEQANDMAAARLYEIGRAIAHTEFVLSLEPVPGYYGADYLTSTSDILAMVDRVGHPNIGLHLDVACVGLGGGDIAQDILLAGRKRIQHFHISEKDLAGFDAPGSDHIQAAQSLKSIGYDKAVAIEMKTVPGDWQRSVKTAVTYADNTYLDR